MKPKFGADAKMRGKIYRMSLYQGDAPEIVVTTGGFMEFVGDGPSSFRWRCASVTGERYKALPEKEIAADALTLTEKKELARLLAALAASAKTSDASGFWLAKAEATQTRRTTRPTVKV
jgi:hypothetical protein